MKEKIENMPVLVFLLIGVAIAGYIYMGSLSVSETLQTEISSLNGQIQDKNATLTRAKNAAAEVPTMKEEIGRISQTLSKATDLIPSNSSPRDVLEKISNEAKIAGIRVKQSRPAEVVQKNYYDEMPLEVEFEGSYTQLTLFMYSLSKQRLIIHPVDMSLATKEIIDNQTNLKLDGKLVGFRYKETKR